MSDPTPTNTSTPAGENDAQTENQHTPVDPTGARFPVDKGEEVAPRVDAVIETFEGDPNDTKSRELIEAAIPPCERYDLEIKVVTRLAGIPIKGVKIERAVRNSDSEFHPIIGNYLADLTENKLVLKVTYANEKEHLKPEIVTITLTKLTPNSCDAAERANAKFKYLIREILRVKNLPSVPSEESRDFTDDDEVVAKKYNIDQDYPYITPTQIVENSFTVEKKQSDDSHTARAIFHLNVSMATFSLDVPYINQNAGFVKIGHQDISDHNTANINFIFRNLPGDHADSLPSFPLARADVNQNPDFTTEIGYPTTPLRIGHHYIPSDHPHKYIKRGPWSGECLCAPTTATMILMYYGISTGSTATPGGGDKMRNRAGLMARFTIVEFHPGDHQHPGDNPNAPQFEPWPANMPQVIKNIYHEKEKNENAAHSIRTDIPIGNEFEKQIKTMLPFLAEGDPLYAGIVGGHILAVRGAVVGKGETKLWAICNDPYGTLAGPESDYSKNEHSDPGQPSGRFIAATAAWYAGPPVDQNSSQRKERNIDDVDDDSLPATKGKNVYYNGKTHSRNASHNFGRFTFNYAHSFHYRSASENTLAANEKYDKKVFVSKKLVKGEQ